jgi:biotin-dependent carboxylase-like uncharacterized protein
MASASFIVTHVGPHTSIQDSGRRGLMRFGVPASGPMDRTSFAIANTALGNAIVPPGIEISMGGLQLDCVEGSVTIALAGGGFQVALDQSSFGSWAVATVHAGSKLVVKPGPWGSWTYLTFAGDLQAKRWLGSAATHSQSGFGGGQITKGQRLVIENAEVRDERCGEIPCPVFARPRTSVRIVLGPQDRFFGAEAIGALLSQPFSLTDAYDRMGVRLAGPTLRPVGKLDMPSEAIVRGSIQVAGDGRPTVLLADHQTTGGYPKIATVIADDVDCFVQLRPRHQAVFESITPQMAIEAAGNRRRANEQFLARLRRRS